MFGTLVCDLQHEPLTFVENTDPASALSRNRRDKPHASCELCRARKIRCSGQRTGCDRCIAMSVECRYRDRNGRRKRQASTAGTSSTSSSTSATDTKQQGESSHLANPSTTTSEATPQPDNTKERMDDWQMDTDGLFDPALSAQLGSPNHPLDMPGEIAWNSILGDDHSTLTAAGSVDFTATNSSISSPTSYEQLLAQPLDIQPGSTALEKLELEAQNRRDSETRQQLQNLVLQQPDPFNPSLLQPATAGMMEEEKCLCRRFTATLFEELCAESADNNHAAMDVLLRYFRGALSHCATVLDCERCSASAADSSSNMLLVMAGQYMSTICERMAVCYANIRKRNESRQSSIPSTLDWSSEMDFADAAAAWDASSAEFTATDGDMWFSTYRIESNEEKLLVLRCLVTVQLNEFSRLLERLKSRAGSRSVCLVLLTDAERRLRSAKSILLEATKQAAGGTSKPF